MDRSTAKKFMSEFTTDVDVGTASGIKSSPMLDQYINNALKPLIEEGKIMRRTAMQGSNRRTTYAFDTNSPAVKQAVQGILSGASSELGMEGSAPFSISNVRSRAYTQTTERILDPRVAASVRAEVMKAGGMSSIDRATGQITYRTSAQHAQRIHSQVDARDQAYMRGELSSSASSSATPYEKAYSSIARTSTADAEKKRAMADFVKKNPHSPEAKAAQEMSRGGGGALAQGAMHTVYGAMIGLLATSVGVLVKVYGGVMDTAKNTLDLVTNSMKYNVDAKQMQQYKQGMTALGFTDQEGADVVPSIMGALLKKFGDPTAGGLEGSLKQLAPMYQGKIPDFLSMVAGGGGLQEMMHKIIQDAVNITLQGRSGVRQLGSPEEALPYNSGILAGIAPLLGTLLPRLVTMAQKNGQTSVSADDIQNMMMAGGSITNPYTGPSGQTINAAAANVQQYNGLKAIAEGIKMDVFDRILGVLNQILNVILTMALPYIHKMDPVAANAIGFARDAQNMEAQGRLSTDLSFATKNNPALDKLMRNATTKAGGRYGNDNVGREALFGRVGELSGDLQGINSERAIADIRKEFNMSPEEFGTMYNSFSLMINKYGKLASLKKAYKKSTLWGIGGDTIENQTLPTPGTSDAEIVAESGIDAANLLQRLEQLRGITRKSPVGNTRMNAYSSDATNLDLARTLGEIPGSGAALRMSTLINDTNLRESINGGLKSPGWGAPVASLPQLYDALMKAGITKEDVSSLLATKIARRNGESPGDYDKRSGGYTTSLKALLTMYNNPTDTSPGTIGESNRYTDSLSRASYQNILSEVHRNLPKGISESEYSSISGFKATPSGAAGKVDLVVTFVDDATKKKSTFRYTADANGLSLQGPQYATMENTTIKNLSDSASPTK